ncbi:MAG: nucleotidyltransferase domain-containing protein [Candidatus Hydrogenedentales bacterium]|jgi:predicted nucleotidyltransferase
MKTVAPEVLSEMVRRLVVEFDPQQVILFGSRAWGEPTEDSDVDLCVIVSDSKEPKIKRMQRARTSLGLTGVPTDVLVMTQAKVSRFKDLKASLEYRIRAQGKVLYDRSAH